MGSVSIVDGQPPDEQVVAEAAAELDPDRRAQLADLAARLLAEQNAN